MKILGVIIARTGSKRIPGKALIEIEGKTVLNHIIDIAKKITYLNSICITTTDLDSDKQIVEIAKSEKVDYFCGDSENVLDRIYNAASFFKADIIVYIGADCPLLDPNILNNAIDYFLKSSCDYLNNYDVPSMPEGYDINILTFKALKVAFKKAIAPSQRIHPFSYITFHESDFFTKQFVIKNKNYPKDLGSYHWSLDNLNDIDFIKKIYHLSKVNNIPITLENILNFIKLDPELYELNKSLKVKNSSHSFLNSKSIMDDIINDILYMTSLAQSANNNSNIQSLILYFKEIRLIINKFENISQKRKTI